MNKKSIITIVIIVAVIIIAAGAYMFYSSQDDGTVTIGYLPSDHDAALFIADAQDMYQKEGINAKLVQFNNGGDLMTAMASGEVDVGYVGITPVLSSIEKGVPVKVISGVQTEGSGIVVSNSSGITSVQDLEGKSIATLGEASIQYMLLKYYLNQNNIDIKDLKVSAMKVPSMNDALKSNQIDGMLTYEPFVTTAVENGNTELVDSSEIIPGHPCCVVAASDDFLKEHPDEAKKIVEIHANATKYVQEHPDDAVSQLPKDIVANPDIEKKSLSGINFVSGLDDAYKQNVMDFMNIEVDLGVLKEKIPADKIFYDVTA